MEKSTSLTFLFHKAAGASAFTKLIDITSYPDVFAAPEKLDVSDMSSNRKKYVPGMVDLPDYEFGFIYTKAGYDKVKALEGTSGTYQLRFGENGEYGCWQWTGDIFATPNGGSVGSAREGKVVCYPETDVVPVDLSTVLVEPIGDKVAVVGTNLTVPITTYPNDATLTVVSSTVAKATAAVSGRNVVITPVAAGTTVITVTAAKADMTSGTETFTVTVS